MRLIRQGVHPAKRPRNGAPPLLPPGASDPNQPGADMEKLHGLVVRPLGFLEVPYGEKHGLMLDWNHAGMDGNPQKL